MKIRDGCAFYGFTAKIPRANGLDRIAVLLMVFGGAKEGVVVRHRMLQKAA